MHEFNVCSYNYVVAIVVDGLSSENFGCSPPYAVMAGIDPAVIEEFMP